MVIDEALPADDLESPCDQRQLSSSSNMKSISGTKSNDTDFPLDHRQKSRKKSASRMRLEHQLEALRERIEHWRTSKKGTKQTIAGQGVCREIAGERL